MNTRLALGGAFIFAYLLFLVIQLPAHIAIGWVDLPANVKLGKVSGSVWQPKISVLAVDGVAINNIDADFSAMSLLLFSPKIDAVFGGNLLSGPKGQVTASLSSQRQTLSDATVEIAANEIVPFLQLPIELEAFGQVRVDLSELVLEQGQCVSAQGQLSWQRAAVSALEQDIELGDFQGRIHCQGDKLALTLDENNKLGLSYIATIDALGNVSGNGFISPGKDFPTQLKQALPFIGSPDPQGRYLLKF